MSVAEGLHTLAEPHDDESPRKLVCGLSANMVSLRTDVLRDQGRRYLVPEGRYFRRFRRGRRAGDFVVCSWTGFESVAGGLLSEAWRVGS